ncbi:MAG: hypothetical protein ACKO5Q_18905, partial [Microcystaceae cyanobacterium]
AQPSLNFWMQQSQKKQTEQSTVTFSDPAKEKELSQTLNDGGVEAAVTNPQDAETLRQLLLVDDMSAPKRNRPARPGSSLGVPTAYGAQWGDVWLGGGFASASLFNSQSDGSVAAGFGLGNAQEAVGLEIFTGLFNLFSDDTFGGDAGNGGAVGFKLHRRLDERGYFAGAIGMGNAIRWGTENIYGGDYDTYFGVLTGRFDLNTPPSFQESDFSDPTIRQEAINIYQQLRNGTYNFMPLVVSVGVGTGAFRSVGALDAAEQNANIFATAGLTLIPELSLITTWTGNQLNVGTSIAPFPSFPIVLNLGAGDVTGNFPQGARFIMSLGYGLTF